MTITETLSLIAMGICFGAAFATGSAFALLPILLFAPFVIGKGKS